MADCIFCRIASDPDAKLVYSDDLVVAFNDIDPQAPTHVLVVPRRHVSSVAEVDDPTTFAALFNAANAVARTTGVADTGYRLVFNVGRDALQSVDHVHLHVIGGRRLSWPPG